MPAERHACPHGNSLWTQAVPEQPGWFFDSGWDLKTKAPCVGCQQSGWKSLDYKPGNLPTGAPEPTPSLQPPTS